MFPDDSYELIQPGTTLAMLRATYPNAYLKDMSSGTAIYDVSYQLVNGRHYRLRFPMSAPTPGKSSLVILPNHLLNVQPGALV